MYKILTALLALILYAPAFSAEKWAVAGERIVAKVCCSRGGIHDPNLANANVLITFNDGDVLHVLKQDRRQFLVGHNRSNSLAWVDQSHLIMEASFRPIFNWKGRSSFTITSEDGGTERILNFSRDGTFTASERSDGDSSELFSRSKWTGRLYRYKNLLWTKRRGGTGDPNDKWSVLHLEKDETACLRSIPASQICI